jgi:hypothetical protein
MLDDCPILVLCFWVLKHPWVVFCNSIVEGGGLSLGRLLERFLGCDPPAGVKVPCFYESQSDMIVHKFVESKSASINLLLFVLKRECQWVNGLVTSTRKRQRSPPRSSSCLKEISG